MSRPGADSIVLARSLFGATDEATSSQLRSCLTEVRLERGQRLFCQGEVDERLYVIAEGRIKLARDSAHGRSIILALLGPGQMLGEVSVFDGDPPTCTATAMATSRLFALRRQDLEALLRERPDLALSLMGKLSRRLRHSNESLAGLVFHDTAGRVAKMLVDLSTRFGSWERGALHVRHDLTQSELAELVGCTRESANKTLSEFATRGWVQVEAGSIVLHDLERLRARAR